MSAIQRVVQAEIEAERRAAAPRKPKAWDGLGMYVREIRENVKHLFPSLGNDFEVRLISEGPNPDYRITFTVYHKAYSRDVDHDLYPTTWQTDCNMFSIQDAGAFVNITTDSQLRHAVRKIINLDEKALDAQCRALSEPSPYALGNTD